MITTTCSMATRKMANGRHQNNAYFLDDVIEDIELCPYNEYCPIAELYQIPMCVRAVMETCATSKFYKQYGVDYIIKQAQRGNNHEDKKI